MTRTTLFFFFLKIKYENNFSGQILVVICLQLFEKVKKMRGIDALKKSVSAIDGDVSLIGLGLSDEDRKLLCERVHIVYHGAATVRWT